MNFIKQTRFFLLLIAAGLEGNRCLYVELLEPGNPIAILLLLPKMTGIFQVFASGLDGIIPHEITEKFHPYR